MNDSRDDLLVFGVVTGTHGLRGDLKVRPQSGDSGSVLDAPVVFLRRGAGEPVEHKPVRIALHKGIVLLRLQGLEKIEAVESLVGSEVLMRYSDLPELVDDEYYWYELEGLTVFDQGRGEIGTLEDMFSTPAHDIYVVRGPLGEILIPAVDEFVLDVDLDRGRMTVDLPEGLVPDTDEV